MAYKNIFNSVFKNNLVYRYSGNSKEITVDNHIRLIEKDIFEIAFGCEKKARFKQFLKRGYIGVVIFNDRNWIAHGWMSTPFTEGPPHQPKKVQKMNIYWIFHCRTHEDYRGRGYYKQLLRKLVNVAIEQSDDAEIYIDTSIRNHPSQQGIRSVGFEPAGQIYTLQVPHKMSKKVPDLTLVIGSWKKSESHPENPHNK